MKKIDIREEVDKIFQIIGEENNISDNFQREDYSKLNFSEREMFEEALDFKFNERRGIFRTDFQHAIDKINKVLKKQYNFSKSINNASDFISLSKKVKSSNKTVVEKKNKKKKRTLLGRIIDIFKKREFVDDVFVEDVKENDIFKFTTKSEINNNRILFPNSFGINVGEKTTVPGVPVFRKNVSSNSTPLQPNSVEINDGERTLVPQKVIKQNENNAPSNSTLVQPNSFEINDGERTLLSKESNVSSKITAIFPDSFGINNREEIIVPEETEIVTSTSSEVISLYPNSFGINHPEQVEEQLDNIEDLDTLNTETQNTVEESNSMVASVINNPETTIVNQSDTSIQVTNNTIETPSVRKPKHLKETESDVRIASIKKPKHLKNDLKYEYFYDNIIIIREQLSNRLDQLNKVNREEIQKQLEFDIQLNSWAVNLLKKDPLIPKTQEELLYEKKVLNIYKNKLKKLRSRYRRNSLNLELTNQIRKAISSIDTYIKDYREYQTGSITKEEIDNRRDITSIDIEYVMSEKKPKVLKK